MIFYLIKDRIFLQLEYKYTENILKKTFKYQTITKKILKKLEDIVGKENLFTDRETCLSYAYDASSQKGLPEAVILPISTSQIEEILKIANSYKFPVTPRGSGSGMTGGAIPFYGGIIISLAKFNRILEIDTKDLIAIVEPGVITGDLQREVKKYGLFYPPDPASLNFSTIGGNVAEGAGGPRGLKYGVTRDYVLGLEVVLPTGTTVRCGVRTAKSVVGYDITRLMVGSEGTLGIITKIILKLVPAPEDEKTMMVIFNKIDHASQMVTAVLNNRIIPASMELMDKYSIRCVEEYLNMGLPIGAEAIILFKLDGEKEIVKRQLSKLEILSHEMKAIDVMIAQTEEEANLLWRARQAISPALFNIRPNKINEDIVVPRSKIPLMLSKLEKLAKELSLTIVTFGHAGDGNLHVNIMYDANDPEESRRAKEAIPRIFETTLKLGGSISGEHGIGITKVPFISKEIDQDLLNLMVRIKRIFDPNLILNPGKVFPEQESFL